MYLEELRLSQEPHAWERLKLKLGDSQQVAPGSDFI